ncbi:MAG: hypothetical protein COY42_15790 [Armatimonadetes bacterium CG_4_10_14_0_8_um_filter_66_14]|nr:DUF2997 domain-containing protein [Armatimonadota bacterium]OIO96047.1 MAG: hypothetical protein AUJ96_25525 [Armatimonadetes bacterium CG2_30_66_41]PIU94377.1 MAG: hypothetical protein COS65_07930 [Armatimonadetes bacterium CG06_land_8_20_14_3_00_66_21]PIX49782.1 MAG: hypothetical protein COZ57_02240 [Armatimonadetes bacterium CG_4_8_14_3_um_filter_66_20]PIZ43488.1 MAG: hypothetical protein COY42_15790 [Armatimonadetes bacterium CG_4_10_14_0_8_um_filter_66_14]PJB67229.1 MAG: hypothetical p
MAVQRVVYVIRRDATVEERVEGVPGPACEQATMPFEEALGEVVERTYTADYVLRRMPEPTRETEGAKQRAEAVRA